MTNIKILTSLTKITKTMTQMNRNMFFFFFQAVKINLVQIKTEVKSTLHGIKVIMKTATEYIDTQKEMARELSNSLQFISHYEHSLL